jgi:hypothetical protein
VADAVMWLASVLADEKNELLDPEEYGAWVE